MTPVLIALCVVVVLALMVLIPNIHVVPQAHAYVIERLGAYQGTWSVGFHVKVPIIDKIAKKVILQTDKELIKIIKNSFDSIEVFSNTEKVNDYDVVIPIMNLAYALDIDFNNIPLKDSYLKTERKDISSNKLKVGICYQGNKRVFKNRSIPFETISQLSNIQNIQLYSFQIENAENEYKSIEKGQRS